jgi:cysteine desulfurase
LTAQYRHSLPIARLLSGLTTLRTYSGFQQAPDLLHINIVTFVIDLDNNATTPTAPEAITAAVKAMAPHIANPSSTHKHGRAARKIVEQSRDEVAAMMGASAEQVVFTSGATEGNDAILRMHDDRVLFILPGGHPSLAGDQSKRRLNLSLTETGEIDLNLLRDALETTSHAIIAISMVSGETGVIQPVHEVCEIATSFGVPTLVDQAQAVGRVPADILNCGATYRTVSAHKMNGPKGIGCLILGSGEPAPSMAAGGGQENGRRSGTENVPGIAGFGAASRVRLATLDTDLARMAAMRDALEQQITGALPFVHVNGRSAPRAATTTSLTFAGVDGMALVARLDASGVLCSQVSACSSGRPEPSVALMSMGLTERLAFSTIRFSVSIMTTKDTIKDAADIIVREAGFLHDIMKGAA